MDFLQNLISRIGYMLDPKMEEAYQQALRGNMETESNDSEDIFNDPEAFASFMDEVKQVLPKIEVVSEPGMLDGTHYRPAPRPKRSEEERVMPKSLFEILDGKSHR